MGAKRKQPAAKRVTKVVPTRLTEDEYLVVLYLSEIEKTTLSALTRRVLRDTYDFDDLLPKARLFFDETEQLIARQDSQID